jgi:uncharacterized iron-regulated protein
MLPSMSSSRASVVFGRLLLCGCLLGAAGCDGGESGMAAAPDAGAPATDAGSLPPTLPTTGHSYRLVHGRGDAKGKEMATGDLLAQLATADVVCLGEEHVSPDAHAVQQMLVDHLVAAAPPGRRMALGMEMFQVPFQPALDDFSAGKIDEATMLVRTQWQTRWGYDFGFYRPAVERMIGAGGTVRALNATDELVKQVDIFGLDGLSAADRAMLPDLDLDDAAHKAWFMATADAIPAHAGVKVENLYQAQVVRDETMADTAARWLTTQPPGPRQLAIIAGNGHCIDLAVPARIRRRTPVVVLSVHPVADTPADLANVLQEGMSDVLVMYGL